MEYQAHVLYDRDLIAEAARRYVARSIRWDGFAAFFVLVGVLAYLVVTGDRSWIVGFVAAVLLLMPIVGAALFIFPYPRALARFPPVPTQQAAPFLPHPGLRSHSPLSN